MELKRLNKTALNGVIHYHQTGIKDLEQTIVLLYTYQYFPKFTR